MGSGSGLGFMLDLMGNRTRVCSGFWRCCCQLPTWLSGRNDDHRPLILSKPEAGW